MYAEMIPPKPPPCDKCRVDPIDENRDAIEIFLVIQSQMIMGPSGPVDLNHLAIHEAMKLYKIKNRTDCFNKVRTLGHWWVDRLRTRDGE
jgi:hypothetical protein